MPAERLRSHEEIPKGKERAKMLEVYSTATKQQQTTATPSKPYTPFGAAQNRPQQQAYPAMKLEDWDFENQQDDAYADEETYYAQVYMQQRNYVCPACEGSHPYLLAMSSKEYPTMRKQISS